jgi:hypothetical protein
MPTLSRSVDRNDADDPAGGLPRVLVWCRRGQAGFIEAVVSRLAVSVTRIGFPADEAGRRDGDRSGRAGESAAGRPAPFAAVERFDDLRAAVAAAPGQTLIAADDGGGGDEGVLDDASFLRLCSEREVRVISLEPAPSSLDRLASVAAAERDQPIVVAPLLAHARLFGDVQELLPHLGAVRTAVFNCRGAPAHGSLAARLFDAMTTLHAILGLPDRIDCNVTPGSGTSPAATALTSGQGRPTTMRSLSGHATAHLRYPSGASAAVAASNQAGPWFRGLTLLGDHATLRLSDDALELLSPMGEPLERSDGRTIRPRVVGGGGEGTNEQGDDAAGDGGAAGVAGRRGRGGRSRADPGDATPSLFGRAPGPGPSGAMASSPRSSDPAAPVFAEELRRVLDPGISPAVRIDRAEALAMCEAALLSARTANPEHTQTILNISGARPR